MSLFSQIKTLAATLPALDAAAQLSALRLIAPSSQLYVEADLSTPVFSKFDDATRGLWRQAHSALSSSSSPFGARELFELGLARMNIQGKHGEIVGRLEDLFIEVGGGICEGARVLLNGKPYADRVPKSASSAAGLNLSMIKNLTELPFEGCEKGLLALAVYEMLADLEHPKWKNSNCVQTLLSLVARDLTSGFKSSRLAWAASSFLAIEEVGCSSKGFLPLSVLHPEVDYSAPTIASALRIQPQLTAGVNQAEFAYQLCLARSVIEDWRNSARDHPARELETERDRAERALLLGERPEIQVAIRGLGPLIRRIYTAVLDHNKFLEPEIQREFAELLRIAGIRDPDLFADPFMRGKLQSLARRTVPTDKKPSDLHPCQISASSTFVSKLIDAAIADRKIFIKNAIFQLVKNYCSENLAGDLNSSKSIRALTTSLEEALTQDRVELAFVGYDHTVQRVSSLLNAIPRSDGSIPNLPRLDLERD